VIYRSILQRSCCRGKTNQKKYQYQKGKGKEKKKAELIFNIITQENSQ
jgi:hypothetical protein